MARSAGVLQEDTLLEDTLLEGTLLEGALLEGTLLEARRPRRSPKTDQEPPKAATRNRQFSMGEPGSILLYIALDTHHGS